MKLPKKVTKPYRLGVAFSGGGARGFAHIGAIRALADCGVRPDIVAGVSAGSVVAAFYAAGLLETTYDNALLEMFGSGKVRDFTDLRVPHNGLFGLDKFKALLEKYIPYENIEQLPIKTLICATDLDQGTKEVFATGKLSTRIAASCSIPIVFEPVEIEGRRYVDGGVLRNLPAYAIRHLCDTLIGINCSPLDNPAPAEGLIQIAQRSYVLATRNNTIQDMEMCDLVINLNEVAEHQAFDLNNLNELVKSGYLTAMKDIKDFLQK